MAHGYSVNTRIAAIDCRCNSFTPKHIAHRFEHIHKAQNSNDSTIPGYQQGHQVPGDKLMNGALQRLVLIDQFRFTPFVQKIPNFQFGRIIGYCAQAPAPQVGGIHDFLDRTPGGTDSRGCAVPAPINPGHLPR